MKKNGWANKIFWVLVILGMIAWKRSDLFAIILTSAITPIIYLLNFAILGFAIWAMYRIGKESLFGIPPNQAAIIKRQWFPGGTPVRTGRIVTQSGLIPIIKLGVKIPWADRIDLVELKEVICDFRAKVIAKDGVAIDIPGTFAYVPDFRILDAGGVPIFGTTTKEDIVKTAEAITANKLAAIGGTTESDEILQNIPSIDQMLKGIMQTPQLPHLYLENGENISAEQLVKFYKTNWKAVNNVVELYHNAPDKHSDLELANGIDIRWIKVKSPVLSPESQKAKDEKARVSAIQKGHGYATSMVKAFLAEVPDTKPETAVNFVAQELYGSTTTRVINSVEASEGVGVEGLLALAAANLGKAVGKGK